MEDMMENKVTSTPQTYKVSIVTGTAPFGGSDALIYMEILGRYLWSTDDLQKYVQPFVGRDPFERGQTDTFDIEVPSSYACVDCVGFKVQHGHNNGWWVDSVTVTGPIAGTGVITTWVARPNGYLEDNGNFYQFPFIQTNP